MIAAPGLFRPRRREIWTPPRRKVRWCPVHRVPVTNMAAGDEMLDDSGNVILDDSGNILLSDGAGNSCCCTNYIRAKRCSDLAYVDLWFVYNDDGTIQTTAGANTTLPFYFFQGGVTYFVTSTHTVSSAGGTLAAGYVIVTQCPDGDPCGFCTDTPSELTVTFDSVSICACVQAGPNNMYGKKIELDGTYCLTQTAGNACFFQTTITSSILQFWFNSGGISSCAGPATGDLGDTDVFVCFSSGNMSVTARHATASVVLFDGSLSVSDCVGPHTVSNAVGACGGNDNLPSCAGGTLSALICATGGTATVSNGC